MKPTRTMLGCVLMAGLASAQNPSVIQNVRNTMNTVRDNSAAASSAALGLENQAAPAVSTAPTAWKANTITVASTKKSSGSRIKTSTPHTAVVHKNPAPQTGPMEPKPKAPEAAVVANSTPPAVASEDQTGSDKYNANGRRDPFLSPVVSHGGGSGCSTGKKCLDIGEINLRGIVHSDAGFIAVVSNGLNKAYFLRENDPVFNGYVVKITGDSIVFQETLQDRLGKTFTREVVKKITTPAV